MEQCVSKSREINDTTDSSVERQCDPIDNRDRT